MRSYIIGALTCGAIGAILGINIYKRLHPRGPTPVVEDVKRETETRTIIRYVNKAGHPVEKETITSSKEQKTATPLPTPRPRSILGISGRLTPNGEIKAGPVYGRELFHNTYITGGVQVSPTGPLKPEITVGVQLLF